MLFPRVEYDQTQSFIVNSEKFRLFDTVYHRLIIHTKPTITTNLQA